MIFHFGTKVNTFIAEELQNFKKKLQYSQILNDNISDGLIEKTKFITIKKGLLKSTALVIKRTLNPKSFLINKKF